MGRREAPAFGAVASRCDHVGGGKTPFGKRRSDPQTDVAPGRTRGRNVRSKNQCSMCPAIHTKSRSWLRSSSTREPSDPLLRVVFRFFGGLRDFSLRPLQFREVVRILRFRRSLRFFFCDFVRSLGLLHGEKSETRGQRSPAPAGRPPRGRLEPSNTRRRSAVGNQGGGTSQAYSGRPLRA